jgi:haloacetate dehalogenase
LPFKPHRRPEKLAASAVRGVTCEDYRARHRGTGIDRAHDDADRAAGRRVACPVLVLWATGDDLPDLYGDVLAVWRPWAGDLRGGPVEPGHHMAEDAPGGLAARLAAFLAQTR